MPDDKNVLDQFSEEFKVEENKTDEFAPSLKKEEPTEGQEPEVHKNRRHRRLEEENRRLREEAIALGARIQGISEAQKFAQGLKTADVDEQLITLYGDHENGRKAAQITQSLLDKAVSRAKEEARLELEKALEERDNEVAREESVIDEEIEAIEDRFNIDLSGSTEESRKVRNGFLSFVEKLSHKDREGNIDQYADFGSAWEEYQERLNRIPSSRSKELASRSMVRSGSSTTKAEDIATQKFLKDAGII